MGFRAESPRQDRRANLGRLRLRFALRVDVAARLTIETETVMRTASQLEVQEPRVEPNLLEELRWYFHARGKGVRGPNERFDQAARAFGAPRFQALYRAWRERGEPVLDATLSSVLADHVAWGTGRLECHVLPHSYVCLLPLVDTA